jgi:HEAT repeat protein
MRLALYICGLIVLGLNSTASAADAKQLAAALSAGTPAERHAAADGLADLGYAAQEAVPQLIAALGSNDPELRWRAARALGVIGDAKAAPALRKQTADSETLVRAQAIFALGRLRASDEESLKAIVERLSDQDAQVRRASIRALRMIEAPRQTVIPLIVKLLNDSDPTIAMRALSSIAEGGVEVVPALTAALKERDARYWACVALGEIGPQAKAAVPGLIEVLSDDRPEVRLQATIALGEIGPDAKPAAGALVKLVNDPFESVQASAIFALGRLGDSSAESALAKVESSTNPLLHMLATWALAKIDHNDEKRINDAIQRLVTGLGDKNRDVAHMAAKALADLEVNPDKVRPLVEKMVAANPEVSDRVLGAFASLGARAVPHAIAALKDPQRRVRALQVLARIGPEAAPAVPGLIETLKNGDAATKVEALFALGAIGPKAQAAVTPISDQLGDKDLRVVQAAGYALGKIGPAAKEAIPALTKLNQSEDELLKLTSVWAVLKIAPRSDELTKNSLPILTGALKNSREFVRVEAAMTLGELGPSAAPALPALESATSDTSAAVRSAATAAIKKIKG